MTRRRIPAHWSSSPSPRRRPRTRRGPRKRLKFLLLTQLTCSGCFSATPFQSARVTEPGERTGHISYQRSRPRDEEAGEGWVMIEGGTRLPLGGGRVDLGINGAFVSYDPVTEDGPRFGGAMFGIGPKFEVIDDVLAVDLPARFTFAGAGTFHTTHFYPRAILSLPVAPGVEVNLSATRFLFPGSTAEMPWGYSVGLALGRRGGDIFRPEIGVLDYPEGGDMIQFGLAYTPEFRISGAATAQRDEPKARDDGPISERTPH